jgi:DNA-binding winged helix-turn-helix (wHTH) protein
MHEPFVLQQRFLVFPATNTVTDQSTGKEVRLEQRLVEVLCLLADTPNQLVTRETIIARVWNDYGGADEGLTQAISYLRKVLLDTQKEVIETIPKKGYILHADVQPAPAKTMDVAPQAEPNNTNRLRRMTIILLIVIIAGVVAYFLIPAYHEASPGAGDVRPTSTPDADARDARVEPDTSRPTGADVFNRGAGNDTAAVRSPDVIGDTLH